MKNVLYILGMAGMLILCANSVLPQEIVFTAEMEKPEYMEGEPVYLFVSMTNVGKTPYVYERFYLSGMTLRVKVRGDGDYLPYAGPIAEYMGEPQQFSLLAGETAVRCVILSESYPSDKFGSDGPFLSSFPFGTYTAHAEYENKGKKYFSSPVHFRIVAAWEKERKARDEIKNIFTDVYRKRTRIIFARELERFLSAFPHSVYAPLAQTYLIQAIADTAPQKAKELTYELVNNYPDKPFISKAIARLRIEENEKDSLYERVAKNSKNEKVKKLYEFILREMKKYE